MSAKDPWNEVAYFCSELQNFLMHTSCASVCPDYEGSECHIEACGGKAARQH